LTLIGNLNNDFYLNHLAGKENIYLIPALPQVELNNELSKFDIGLAIENNNEDENRNVCLTNKIWSYFQAGLFIVASDTPAQHNFLNRFNEHGIIMNLFDEKVVEQILREIYEQWDVLSQKKLERFNMAKQHAWETESEKLAREWQRIQ
jgi:hypothetical protein